MTNPLTQAIPPDPIQQVHDYARDLAYLAINGALDSGSRFNVMESPHEMKTSDERIVQFKGKWGEGRMGRYGLKAPDPNVLVSFGYLTRDVTTQNLPSMPNMPNKPLEVSHTHFQITEKAFRLLERPAQAPSIFISYRRQTSSALALLIEARLRIVGAADVFVDKNIAPGDDWQQVLEQNIEHANTFIVLIGPQTLNSEGRHVEQEIAWAVKANCRILSVWHQGRRIQHEENYPSILAQKQFIVVEQETARHYEAAMAEILNSLGYRTY